MAEINPPSWLQARTDHKAQQYRRMLASVVGDGSGIVTSLDLGVTQNGTPNMSVNVATGRAFILGTLGTYQGLYHVDNQGVVNKSISAAHATNPRYDRVYAVVADAEYAGVTNAWSIEVATGTPAASPSEPSLPSNSLELARITVGAAVTSITNANILDRRVSAPAKATAWTAPTLLNSWVNFGTTFQVAGYRKVGDVVALRGMIKNGTVAGLTVLFTLPSGFRPPADLIFATAGFTSSGKDVVRVDVDSSGNVKLGGALDGANYLSLSNIQFSTVF